MCLYILGPTFTDDNEWLPLSYNAITFIPASLTRRRFPFIIVPAPAKEVTFPDIFVKVYMKMCAWRRLMIWPRLPHSHTFIPKIRSEGWHWRWFDLYFSPRMRMTLGDAPPRFDILWLLFAFRITIHRFSNAHCLSTYAYILSLFFRLRNAVLMNWRLRWILYFSPPWLVAFIFRDDSRIFSQLSLRLGSTTFPVSFLRRLPQNVWPGILLLIDFISTRERLLRALFGWRHFHYYCWDRSVTSLLAPLASYKISRAFPPCTAFFMSFFFSHHHVPPCYLASCE